VNEVEEAIRWLSDETRAEHAECKFVANLIFAELHRLRSGYQRLYDSSDKEMRDGDLARDIAKAMLNLPT
jgi:hypothetical protein